MRRASLDLALPRGENHRSSGSMHEFREILSQVVVHHLHAVVLDNAHQDGFDDLIAKVDTDTFSRAQPEPPIRVTVLGRKEFTEAIRSEDVSVGTPNGSLAIKGVSVDEYGSLRWDVVSVEDFRIGSQLWKRVEQHRMQTARFEVAVVEEGVGLADVCVGSVLAVGAEGFVCECIVDFLLESGHDCRVHADLSGNPRDRGCCHVWKVELDASVKRITI